MPRPTSRGYALLALAVATYLAGRIVGTWELYLIAFAFLAILLLSWGLVALTSRRIRVTRVLLPEQPVAGDEPEFSLIIKNASLIPGPQLTLHIPLTGLAASDAEIRVGSLNPRGEKEVKTHIEAVNRGVHALPAVRTFADDLLGLVGTARKVSDPLTVTVVPKIARLDSCVLHPDVGLRHDWSGRHGLRATGASEFRSVRPHQPGEPLSHIDWKSTAKTGALMLREMEDPAAADVTILLDGTARQVVGEAPHSNYELAVRAAGSIADFAIRTGRGVTLVSHERRRREFRLTSDGGGRRALLQALAESQATASTPLVTTLRHLRAAGVPLLRAQSVTIVGLSLDKHLVRSLIELKEEGGRPAFLYVAGASFTEGTPPGESSLLPFLPPQKNLSTKTDAEADPGAGRGIDTRSDADTERSVGSRTDAVTPKAGSSSSYAATSALAHDIPIFLSAESRALLLSLSSAGIPCLTIGRGESLEQRLSLERTGRRARTAVWG